MSKFGTAKERGAAYIENAKRVAGERATAEVEALELKGLIGKVEWLYVGLVNICPWCRREGNDDNQKSLHASTCKMAALMGWKRDEL